MEFGIDSMCRNIVIAWLALLNRLKTKERLWSMSMVQDCACLICGHNVESVRHLFFQCYYSSECLRRVKEWLKMSIVKTEMTELLDWIKKKKGVTKLYRSIMYAGIVACVYRIWMVRNEVFWNLKVWSIELTVQNVKKDVYNRIQFSDITKIKLVDKERIERLCKL